MDEFMKVLIGNHKSDKIPDEHNLFGHLIGEWDFEWIDNHGTPQERHLFGEWIFSWIIDGTAIQDLFICPSRKERLYNQQPDAEYGTTIRLYNPNTQAWDIFYGCMGVATRLEAKQKKDRIVLTEITEGNMRWVFSEMTDDTFHWQRIEKQPDNQWKVMGEALAKRRHI